MNNRDTRKVGALFVFFIMGGLGIAQVPWLKAFVELKSKLTPVDVPPDEGCIILKTLLYWNKMSRDYVVFLVHFVKYVFFLINKIHAHNWPSKARALYN